MRYRADLRCYLCSRGAASMEWDGATPELVTALQAFKRQALHAGRLELEHPVTLRRFHWTAPMPPDLQTLIDVLRADVKSAK